MSYDFTKASELVRWAKEQIKNPNYYKLGGIGRYDGDKRQFDCCGLFKCFMWHDYSTTNPSYYNKTQKDLNCEGLIAEAKEKGPISTIPEIPGILVYQKGHMGIYIGDGEVIESTAKKYDGKTGKIYKTYFKGNHTGYKRDTWTDWFKSPYLTYEEEKPLELKYKVDDKVLVNGYLYVDCFGNGRGKELKDHVGAIMLTSTKKNTTKPYHIDLLGWVDESSILPYTNPPKEDVKEVCSLSCEDVNTLKKLLEFLSKLIKLLKDLFKGK